MCRICREAAREQIETMVCGGCYRDRKDTFDFGCSRDSNRRSLALSGNMIRQRDCDLRVYEYAGLRTRCRPMGGQGVQKIIGYSNHFVMAITSAEVKV